MQSKYRTGRIWKQSPRKRAQIVRRVCESLEKTYGQPRLGNPSDPVDDLVYIIISNKTSPQMAHQTYERVKQVFSVWDDVLAAPASSLQKILKPAGLATVKSKQIFASLSRIRYDFNACSINHLVGRPNEEIHEYLISLPGVSEKVAKCVMLFTLGVEVLPVDSHVYRITRRLGWNTRNRADQCHVELEELVPPKRRYAFHVDCVMNGRSVCRPKNPKCGQCCINNHCMYFREKVKFGAKRKTDRN